MQPSNNYSILLTTSRKPPSRGRNFLKELDYILPKSVKINRGHLNVGQIFETALKNKCTRVLILSSHHGNPSLISGYQQISPNDNELGYNWFFDWHINALKLKSELNSMNLKKLPLQIFWSFIDLQKELESLLSNFFHISKNVTDNWNLKIEIIHIDPGYLFQCFLKDGSKISPEFIIEEIRVADS